MNTAATAVVVYVTVLAMLGRRMQQVSSPQVRPLLPVFRGVPRADLCSCVRLRLAKIAKFRKSRKITPLEKNTGKFPPPFEGLLLCSINVEKLRLDKTGSLEEDWSLRSVASP